MSVVSCCGKNTIKTRTELARSCGPGVHPHCLWFSGTPRQARERSTVGTAEKGKGEEHCRDSRKDSTWVCTEAVAQEDGCWVNSCAVRTLGLGVQLSLSSSELELGHQGR